jgi:hypothetical protein
MHLLTHHVPQAGQVVGSARSPLVGVFNRAKLGMLLWCRPVIRSLGMSDTPWGAVFWILLAVVLALLFMVTVVMFEGSMWS